MGPYHRFGIEPQGTASNSNIKLSRMHKRGEGKGKDRSKRSWRHSEEIVSRTQYGEKRALQDEQRLYGGLGQKR